jgi:hypothetical protein
MPFKTVERKPQTSLLIEHFAKSAKRSITPLEAAGMYRIRSLSRRINDLEEVGYSFHRDNRTDPTGQRYTRYVML